MTSEKAQWGELHKVLRGRAKANEPLAPHTTFRIGGPADWYVSANRVDELIELVRLARQHQAPLLILGRGSNVLVSDEGWRGLVIANNADAFDLTIESDSARLKAASGASLPALASRTARQGWCGLEWAIGVPASVGGAVVGNAGAHGGDIASILQRVKILDAENNVRELSNAECEFEYRHSRFKKSRGREIVLEATFRLERDEATNCIARMNQYSEHRRRTQPTEPSVGSMFKNPPNDYAGRLIDAAGVKGTRVGQVEVSRVHGNFFVNLGGATNPEVVKLIELVRASVKEKFGIELELEIEVIGSQ